MKRRGSRRDMLPVLLAAHNEALSACVRCGLAESVRPIISEARTPRAMLVGQAPGKVEVGDRRPFAGRAGKTLFSWLSQAGVEEAEFRRDVYIAAITRCYPGPSPSGRGDRVPSTHEREMCSGWLESELRIIRPALLIPVGRLAIDRFLGAGKLSELVGKRHLVRHDGGESVAIPLPHPSGASSWINEPEHRALLGRALELLGEELVTLGVGSGPRSARKSA
ncbi:MAG TPA: uracil-DNA glycosylase family protein [Gemmatimonadaceae bacterium]|nr:uracil-DNA glycosylase family protein [Gemmatimonadaceae bacterium]